MSRGSERSVKRANLTRTGKLYPAGLSRYRALRQNNTTNRNVVAVFKAGARAVGA